MSRHPSSLAALTVCLGLGAFASEPPKLVIVPFVAAEGANEAAAQKFTQLLDNELKTRSELTVVSAPSARAAPAERPAAASRARGPNPEAVNALASGKTAFEEVRLEEAVRDLRRGIEGMLADPATADMEGVIDGELKLAAASFRMGEEKDAKNALNELARLSPKFELPPGFPPVFIREFEKAKKRLDKQPRGSISVEGPPGATAFVDGRDLGMVPVLEEQVPAGLHYVKVEGTKGERFGQVVEVKGQVTKVKASFGGAAPPEKLASASSIADPRVVSPLDEGVRDRLAAYVKAVGADFALVGVVWKSGDTQLTAGTAVYSAKKNGFVALSPVTFDSDVLTAPTEAYKLGDDAVAKLGAFGSPASLPLSLVSKRALAVAKVEPEKPQTSRPETATKKSGDEIEVAGPRTRTAILTPKPETRVFEKQSEVVDGEIREGAGSEKSPEVKKGGVPVWVIVVTTVVVAAGAGVGGYFGYTALTKPVTGTVTASW